MPPTRAARARLVICCMMAVSTSSFSLNTLPPGRYPGAAAVLRSVAEGTAEERSSTAAGSAPKPKGCLAAEVRDQFPILNERHPGSGERVVYLDSAASSQKPLMVLEAVDSFYREANSNVHRGAHFLANRATERYEAARDKVAAFVNAGRREEIVFTRGATEAINLVANTWGAENLGPGDEVILSVAEHHSNLVPWQLLAERQGVLLHFVQLDPHSQRYDVTHLQSLLSPRTKLIALGHVSNVLGALNPVQEVVTLARECGARVLLDACQSVPHMPVDVQALGVDWLVASGHKMCGPTGIGFLWGRHDVLETMPPWQGGGEMIDQVYLDHSTYAAPPSRFEAGTPAIAQAVGLGAACDFLSGLGMDRVAAHEAVLAEKLWTALSDPSLGLTLYGPSPGSGAERCALAAFTHETVHASDLTYFLDANCGVAVRAGHHCTQPLHRDVFRVPGTARASLYLYNDEAEICALVKAIEETTAMMEAL